MAKVRHSRPVNRLARDERGAIMVIAVFMAIFLAAVLFYLVGIADAAIQRASIQDGADAIAFAAAVVHAKGMNTIVMVNILMAALLSVLVTIRMLETLLFAGAALLVLGQLYAPAARCAEAGRTMERVFQTVRPPVNTAMQVANKLGHGVAYAMPVLAEARALEAGFVTYKPRVIGGAAVPQAFKLPVEDGDPRQLCEKAGEFAASLIWRPLATVIPKALADFIEDKLQGLVSLLAESVPGWFCGIYDGDPPRITMEQERRLPETEAARRCRTGQADDVGEACERANQEAQDAEPGAGGDCVTGCEPGGPYDAVAAAARRQCRPGSHEELKAFRWQERVIHRRYHKLGAQLQRVPGPDEVYSAGLRTADQPPCGPDGSVGDTWRGSPQPLCDGEADAPLLPDGDGFTRTFVEVSEIFSCVARVEVDVTPKGNTDEQSGKSGKGKPRGQKPSAKPLKLEDDVVQGGKPFQIRSFAIGQAWGARALPEHVMDPAVAGEPGKGYELPREAGRLAMAQAEYHYLGDLDENAMWNAAWTARLRRLQFFDPPERDDDRDEQSGQQEQEHGKPGMAGLLDKCQALPICQTLSDPSLDAWVAH